MVLGSSLGTAIIAASFLIGATFNASVRDGARTRLGPVDEQVTAPALADLPKVAAVLRTPRLAHTDGLLTTVRGDAALTALRDGITYAEPSATVGELDFDAARAFGGRPSDTGLVGAGPTPRAGEVLLSAEVADRLHVRVGDDVALHAYGQVRSLRVRDVLDPVGLAGATDAPGATGNPCRARPRRVRRQRRRNLPGLVLVSNVGGVFDSTASSADVVSEIEGRTAGSGVVVESVKADLLRPGPRRGPFARSALHRGRHVQRARRRAAAGQPVRDARRGAQAGARPRPGRRAEALAPGPGLHPRRRLLRRGGGVRRVVRGDGNRLVGGASDRQPAQGGDSSFTLRFVAPTGDLVVAALIGMGLAMATVWITSVRIANLDIIQALRDLPDVPHHRHRLRSSGPAAVGVVLGVALAVWGVVAIVPLAAVLGPPLALLCALPLLRPVVGRRVATAVASVGTLVWCVGVFTFLTRITDRSGVPVFVVQGIVMVAAAVGLATALDRVWTVALEVLTRSGKGLAGRLGLAYPLHRLFRTSMLLGMYALIVFTLTFLAVYAHIFGGQAGTFTPQVAAGYDLQVDANPSSPVAATTLAADPQVRSVATLWRSGPHFSASFHRSVGAVAPHRVSTRVSSVVARRRCRPETPRSPATAPCSRRCCTTPASWSSTRRSSPASVSTRPPTARWPSETSSPPATRHPGGPPDCASSA